MTTTKPSARTAAKRAAGAKGDAAAKAQGEKQEPWAIRYSGVASAACAALAILVSIPAAWLAVIQAGAARTAAADSQAALDNAKQQLAAAQTLASNSTQALVEAKILNDGVRQMAASGAVSADQLRALSDEAVRQRSALERSSQAASDLSSTTRRQLEVAERSASETTRPRLAVAQAMGWKSTGAGEKPQVTINVENLRPTTAAKFWLSWELNRTSGRFSLPIPQCPDREAKPVFAISGPMPVTLTSGYALSPQEAANFRAGTMSLVVLGTLCYSDGERIRRTTFCREIKGESWSACENGNSVD